MVSARSMIGAVAALCVLGAFPFENQAEACPMHMMHGHAQGGHDQHEQEDQNEQYLKHLLKHAKEIGLTPEQVSKLKVMQLDFKRADVRLDADMKVAQLELDALLEDEQASLAAVQTQVDQLKKAEGAHLIAAVKGKRDAMALLTPEQREKDRAHLEHMKSEGGHEGGHGGGMGHGGMMGGHGGGGASSGQEHQH